MSIDVIDCDLLVEVYALDDVLADPNTATRHGMHQLERLIIEAAARIVEKHFERDPLLDGQFIDASGHDGQGDGSRLHFWVKREGKIYRLLVIRFDHDTKTEPILLDGLALVYGDRALIGRFVVYRDRTRDTHFIEALPVGCLSDELRRSKKPIRPVQPTKPLTHRLGLASQKIRGWLHKALQSLTFGIRHFAGSLSALATILSPHHDDDRTRHARRSVASARVSTRQRTAHGLQDLRTERNTSSALPPTKLPRASTVPLVFASRTQPLEAPPDNAASKASDDARGTGIASDRNRPPPRMPADSELPR